MGCGGRGLAAGLVTTVEFEVGQVVAGAKTSKEPPELGGLKVGLEFVVVGEHFFRGPSGLFLQFWRDGDGSDIEKVENTIHGRLELAGQFVEGNGQEGPARESTNDPSIEECGPPKEPTAFQGGNLERGDVLTGRGLSLLAEPLPGHARDRIGYEGFEKIGTYDVQHGNVLTVDEVPPGGSLLKRVSGLIEEELESHGLDSFGIRRVVDRLLEECRGVLARAIVPAGFRGASALSVQLARVQQLGIRQNHGMFVDRGDNEIAAAPPGGENDKPSEVVTKPRG